jgi:glycosyltransferase involved in cell wall biosynthesis
VKKSICIISFSPIARDARVLRQIQYLAPYYDLTIVGYGQPHPGWRDQPHVHWAPIARRTALTSSDRLVERVLSLSSRLHPFFYDRLYWRRADYVQALATALAGRYDAIHANGWNALPVAVRTASEDGARVVFDAHEWEERWYRKLTIRRYAPAVDAAITVSHPIAARYAEEYGLDPLVVMNAPERVPLRERELDPERVRLIHHGAPIRRRRLDLMIRAVALCDRRYQLDFMLTRSHPDYVQELETLAAELAPDRVTFRDAISPEQIVSRIAEYDVGFYLLAPTNYNNLMALPNKFFEYIVAGLAVCIGPSPAMAEIVNRYGIGCVAPSFEPSDVARVLNRLTVDQLTQMRRAVLALAVHLNAEQEMGKVIALYEHLLAQRG